MLDKTRVLKQVTIDECITMVGNVHRARRKFCYIDCKDQQIVAKIEKYWQLVNLKLTMPTNSFLLLEFVMGIIVEEKEIQINWVAFG